MNSRSVCSTSEVSCAASVLVSCTVRSRRLALPPRKFCEKMKDTYPSQCACKFAGKIEFVDQSLALSSNGSFARLNNPVIQRNKYVPPEVYVQ
jgi:hypothetical protein